MGVPGGGPVLPPTPTPPPPRLLLPLTGIAVLFGWLEVAVGTVVLDATVGAAPAGAGDGVGMAVVVFGWVGVGLVVAAGVVIDVTVETSGCWSDGLVGFCVGSLFWLTMAGCVPAVVPPGTWLTTGTLPGVPEGMKAED